MLLNLKIMNIVIWVSKSLYKMLIALMLIDLMKIDPMTTWYEILIIMCFATSVFSSIPFSDKK